MRICLLCYRGNPYCGGQGIYLKYIAEELHRQGHDVHIIVGPPYPDIKEGITVHKIHNNEYFIKKGRSIINNHNSFDIFNPINFYEFFSTRFGAFPEIRSFSLRAYQKLKEIAKTIKFDIIHDNQCLGYGLLMMKSLGPSVVATIHHPLSIDLKNAILKSSSFINAAKAVMFYPIIMQKIVSKRLDHIIAVSEDSKKNNNKYFSVPLNKQTVIYNGLDADIFKPIKNIKKRKGKILFVGNVTDEKKGFPCIAKAMKDVNDTTTLTVVDGGSPHKKGIHSLITNLGVQHKIKFTGKITNDELVFHYNEAEIAIVPSVYEGFGFPAAEAMACGTPVIASNGGALPEVVGDAGIIFPVKDSAKLAEAINELIDDKIMLNNLRNNGLDRVKRLFDWETAVKKIIEVYSQFI